MGILIIAILNEAAPNAIDETVLHIDSTIEVLTINVFLYDYSQAPAASPQSLLPERAGRSLVADSLSE